MIPKSFSAALPQVECCPVTTNYCVNKRHRKKADMGYQFGFQYCTFKSVILINLPNFSAVTRTCFGEVFELSGLRNLKGSSLMRRLKK